MMPALTEAQEDFWQRFCQHTGYRARPVDCDMFGTPDMADELLALVLSGRKRATCTNLRWVKKGYMDMPAPGAHAIVTDAREAPRCIIRTQTVEVKPFHQVTARFAWREGEGTRMLSDWKRGHRGFFYGEALRGGFSFRETDPCIFETFDVVWRG